MMDLPLSEAEFEELVVQALEELPEFFKQKLQNIDVIVTDWPTEAERRAVGLGPGHLLFGLYQGGACISWGEQLKGTTHQTAH
jgi:predicted Zn-dependent protease with MMP-like domain